MTHQPFLQLEANMDETDITLHVVNAGHPHVVEMNAEYQNALKAHAALHALGGEDTAIHTLMIARIARLEVDLKRGLQAVWS